MSSTNSQISIDKDEIVRVEKGERRRQMKVKEEKMIMTVGDELARTHSEG